jgi:hypothetical protein
MNNIKSDIPVRVSGHSQSHKEEFLQFDENEYMPKQKTNWNILQRNVMTEMGCYRAVNDIIIQMNSYGRK